MGVTDAAYDRRTSYSGCWPNGCIPHSTRDQNIRTRWSCKGDLLYNDEGCWIKYTFEEPQDLEIMKIAFYRGKDNTRTLNVYTDGRYHSKITSSGNTNGYQKFDLYTDETSELMLYLDDYESDSDVWLSIAEVCV